MITQPLIIGRLTNGRWPIRFEVLTYDGALYGIVAEDLDDRVTILIEDLPELIGWLLDVVTETVA